MKISKFICPLLFFFSYLAAAEENCDAGFDCPETWETPINQYVLLLLAMTLIIGALVSVYYQRKLKVKKT